jgi:multidrug resistance protein, MATE family
MVAPSHPGGRVRQSVYNLAPGKAGEVIEVTADRKGLGPVVEELRGSVRLALPVVATAIGGLLMGTVDTIMLGHLSAQALAAGAIAHIVSITLLMFGGGVLAGLDPLVSQAFGAGDREAVAGHLRRGLALAVALAVPVSLLMLDLAPLLRLLGEPPGVVGDATRYARLLALGNLPFLLLLVLRQGLQAMSVVRPALLAIAAGNLVNGLANYALIFGHWGSPALGAPGSACATAAARWAMFLILLVAARRPLAERVGPLRGWRELAAAASPRGQAAMLRIGLPIGLHQALELSLLVAMALLMGRFGTEAIAGHQIAMHLCSLSFMVPLGISGAAMTRVGNAIGRGDMAGARRTAVVCLGLGAAAMAVFAAIFLVAPRQLAALFSTDEAVVAAAARLLPIAAVFQVFDGIQVVATGILRGAADTALPAAAALAGYLLIGLPVGSALAFSAGLGPSGLWWGLTLGIGIVAPVLAGRIALRFRGDIARAG